MNDYRITATDFLQLIDACVNALVLSGHDSNTAVETINSVMDMYEGEINNMDFSVVAETMSIMFLGRRYEDSLG